MGKAGRPKIENPKDFVRIGLVVERNIKDDFSKYCSKKGLNISTHLRSFMISELEKDKE